MTRRNRAARLGVMTSEANLWCFGLPFKGRRKLSADELSALKARIDASQRRFIVGRWTGWSGFVVAAAGILAAILESELPKETVAFGIAILVPAFFGVLQEVLFGENTRVRALFTGILSGGMLCAFTMEGQPSGGWHEALLIFCWALGFLGGWGLLILRWREGRILGPVLEVCAADCSAGEVQMFGVQEDVDPSRIPREVEVLPRSAVTYRVDGRTPRDWEVCYLAEVALPSERIVPMSAPVERILTQEEAAEMSTLASRIGRRSMIRFIGITYLSSLVVRLAENLLAHKFEPALSPFGFLIAVAIGSWYLLSDIFAWRDLRRDSQEGIAVVTRMDGESGESVIVTVLPKSGLLWEIDGRPSSLRTFKWW